MDLTQDQELLNLTKQGRKDEDSFWYDFYWGKWVDFPDSGNQTKEKVRNQVFLYIGRCGIVDNLSGLFISVS